jgi:predicted RNA binding protein YcfA (HicA-like mRNA interferase family)
MHRNYKVRALLHDLRRHGCWPQRTKGSHQVWSTPGGVSFPVVVNHPGNDVTPRVLASVRRVLRAEGLELGQHLGATSARGGGR